MVQEEMIEEMIEEIIKGVCQERKVKKDIRNVLYVGVKIV